MASRKRAQKNEGKTVSKHWELVGVAIAVFGFMLFLALITFDKRDFMPETNAHQSYNCIGIVGAYLGKGFLNLFGIGAFLIPLIFIGLGLSLPIPILKKIRLRWPWIILLMATLCCILEIHTNLLPSKIIDNMMLIHGGGYLGYMLYEHVFFIFGKVGATTVLLALYLLSILLLSNISIADISNSILERYRLWRIEMIRRRKEREARRKAEEAKRKSEERERRQLLLEEKRANAQAARQEREAARAAAAAAKANDLSSLSADSEEKNSSEDKPEITSLEESYQIDEEDLPEGSEPPSEQNGSYKIINSNNIGSVQKQITGVIPPPRVVGDYKLPPSDLLDEPEIQIEPQDAEEEMINNAECIRQTLSEFKVEVQPRGITRGPTVTIYEFQPARGIKMSRFTTLSDNLAAALEAVSINILAPITGKSTVGIEVPNREKVKVVMRELLESPEWINSKAKIPIALGKNIYGKAIIADLAEMPHLLVAGSTGSGKSVCINAIVASLLYKFSPEELRFVMVDPKVVELQQYNILPHMIVPVVTDPKKVVLTLKWLVNEMEKRYQIFAKVGVRNIKDFNSRTIKPPEPTPTEEPEQKDDFSLENQDEENSIPPEGMAAEMDKEITVPRDEELNIPEKLSYIVLIIDELADLMVVAGKDVETLITRLTQMARAAGIHCIVATQRPSVDIITGVIKSNIPSRIAFQVASAIDSRTILDSTGAEKLLGKGDMLFLPPGIARNLRIQGALITDSELNSVLNFISEQAKPDFSTDFMEHLNRSEDEVSEEDSGEDEDLIQDCIDVIIRRKRASVSILQRELRLGYNRAARIMDILERRNIVGPSRGSRDREILILNRD